MFKETRTKFTVFNALILIAFLVIFIIALLIVIHSGLNSSGQTYLKEVANVTIDNANTLDNSNFHAQIPYYFIIYGSDNAILSQSVNNEELIEKAHEMLSPSHNGKFSTIRVGENNYRVYTQTFQAGNQTQTIQVLQDESAEEGILSFFCTFLALIGLIGLICLIPLSYFLAGKSLGPVKKSLEDQKQFIADASHELRTPLSVIQTNVELLEIKSDETIGENEKWLGNIATECEDMNRLISELLLIAQAENNRLEYTNERIDFSELVTKTIELMSENFKRKNIKLYSDIQKDVIYVADSEKLRQVIIILLDNALKYTPSGGRVKVSLTETKKYIELTVLDTGIGISQSDIERIFDRFYRCDNTRSRETGGSGLGLNIAKAIVSFYNGKIEVMSELGTGSEFIVKLPIGKGK